MCVCGASVMCGIAFMSFPTPDVLGLTFIFLQIKRRKPWPQMGGKPVEVMGERKGKLLDHRYQMCEVWVEWGVLWCPLVSATEKKHFLIIAGLFGAQLHAYTLFLSKPAV